METFWKIMFGYANRIHGLTLLMVVILVIRGVL